MAELRDPNALMRDVLLAATVYVAGTQLFYTCTKGAIASTDRWENLYLALLAAYATAPEVKILAQKSDESPDSWSEKLRKGGPIIAFWAGMMMAIGALRLWDNTFPMPAELESIALKTIGIFFGTYTIRQYRRGRAKKQAAEQAGGGEESALDARLRENILSTLKAKPQRLQALAETLDIPSRTLSRHLRQLVQEGILIRDAKSQTDPLAVYRLP